MKLLCEISVREDNYELDADAQITVSRLFARLNEQLTEDTIVIADIGDSLFGATELVIQGRTEFLSPAYYTSMGFSLPAALGAQVARPDARLESRLRYALAIGLHHDRPFSPRGF